jgi:hypothetical protein
MNSYFMHSAGGSVWRYPTLPVLQSSTTIPAISHFAGIDFFIPGLPLQSAKGFSKWG